MLFLGITSHIDDEYAWAGVNDPKIMITTSHNPSSRLKQFAKVRQFWQMLKAGWPKATQASALKNLLHGPDL